MAGWEILGVGVHTSFVSSSLKGIWSISNGTGGDGSCNLTNIYGKEYAGCLTGKHLLRVTLPHSLAISRDVNVSACCKNQGLWNLRSAAFMEEIVVCRSRGVCSELRRTPQYSLLYRLSGSFCSQITFDSYANTGMKQLNKHQKKNGAQNYPGIPQKMMVTVGWKRQTNLPCVIYIFRNGDLLSPPFRMVLARSALQEWGIVLCRLSEKANLCTGAVKKLCKLNGDLISQGEELVNGEYYVAVGLEKYKDLPYFELLVPPKIPHHPFRNFPSNRRRSYNQGEVCEDGANDSALFEPAQQLKLWRVHSTGIVPARDPPSPFESKPAKKYPHQDKVTSVFHAKPCQVRQVNQVPGNYSAQENESVYKRRGARQEMVDAQEIGEDEDTQVELPVDQKAAEIVEEEVISKTKGGPSKKCL